MGFAKKSKIFEKMKISSVFFTSFALAQDLGESKKLPVGHPLRRLVKLTQFSEELLNNWYGHLPSQESWKSKFEKISDKMRLAFEKCGSDNEVAKVRRSVDDENFRYDRENPDVATRQITTGFSKWAAKYLSTCKAQKGHQHHEKRMIRWNEKLQEHLARLKNL